MVSSHPTLMNLYARPGLAQLDPGFWVWGKKMGHGKDPPARSTQNLCHAKGSLPSHPLGTPKITFLA